MSTNPIASVLPAATHRGHEALPFVNLFDGIHVQLLQADVETGLWVTCMRADPGVTLQRHRHTGEVFAFTRSGAWKYLEYPEVNTAGSYLYEPAGSVHTLHVLTANTDVTEVWFAIRGANLNLDAAGNVESVLDAGAILELYLAGCRSAGLPAPDVIRR